MRKALTLCLVTVFSLSAISCGESGSSDRAAELEHQRLLVQIQLDADRQRMELEIERLKEEQRFADERDQNQRAKAERQRAQEYNSARTRTANAIKSLRLSQRGSYLDDGSKVLVISNPNSFSVDFNLKCTSRSGYTKTIFLSVGARASTEVGFFEGWTNNFWSGETIELQIGTETILTRTIG